MQPSAPVLSPAGLRRFAELRREAVDAVTERFLTEHREAYAALGPRGRQACGEDLAFHLEFLRPVLEFGLPDPMTDYLAWLTGVLLTRGIAASHVPLSLDWLAQFFLSRMEAAEGAIVAGALRAAKAALAQRLAAPKADAMPVGEWPECLEFKQALLAGDQRQASAIIEGCIADGRGLVGAELHVIQPALYRIGLKWQHNEVSVAQEHLATAIAQTVMALGVGRSQVPAPLGRKVLLACVAGNHHAVGLQMVADAFELDGWSVQNLGADVPTQALVAQVAAWRPHLVGLSISFAHQLPTARGAVSQLQATLGDARPPVILGGLAINGFNALAAHVGAEGWSPDSSAAVVAGTALAGNNA